MITPEEKRAKELSDRIKNLSKYKKDPKKVSLSTLQDKYFIKPNEDAVVSKEYISESADNIAKKLNTLENALDIKVVKGASSKEDILKYIKELKGNDRIDISNIRNAPLNMSDQRWHGGGLQNITDLIQAGANITITGTGTDIDPYIITGSAGSGITLATNSVLNGDQTLLNLVDGTNVTITDDGLGNITINSAAGGGTVSGTGTDNHIARWNGTTDIQDSDIIISDATAGSILVTSDGDNTLDFVNNGDGYGFTFTASDGQTSSSGGGSFVVTSGNGNGAGTSAGGVIYFTGGNAGAGNATGGDIDFIGGNGSGTQRGGRASFVGGQGGATGIGGPVAITAGPGGATSGKGGIVFITAGDGTNGNANGGDIILETGLKNGAGTNGHIFFKDPTSLISAIFDTSLLATSDKIFTFPNTSGTFMLIPAVPANYTISNVTTDRTYDADATSTDELADVLGTLIADLTALGLLQ